MKKIVLWAILGSWLAAMALAGCGQTGPLYMPQSSEPTPAGQNKPATSAAAKTNYLATPTKSLAAPNTSMAAPTTSMAAPVKPLAAPSTVIAASSSSKSPSSATSEKPIK